MKRITRIAAVLAVAGLTVLTAGSQISTEELSRPMSEVSRLARQVGEGVAANPIPTALGLLTFVLTAGIRFGRNKSRPTADSRAESTVLQRAMARATWTQLVADQIALENRHKSLPESIRKAERDACYTENALTECGRVLATKELAHLDAVAKLDSLRKEKARAEAEVTAIKSELQKLAEVV